VPRMLLIGPSGLDGPSDDAPVTAVRRALPSWELAVLSHHPSARRIEGVHCLDPQDGTRAVRAIRSADIILVAGRVQEQHRRRLLRLVTTAGATPGSRSRLACLGIRVTDGPAGIEQPRLVRSLMRHSELTILRDDHSATTLLTLGVRPPFRVGTHLAWGAVEPVAQRSRPDGRVLVVVSCAPGTRTGLDRTACLVHEARTAGLDPVLLPWQAGADMRTASELGASLPATLTGPPSSLEDLVAMTREASLLVSPKPLPIVVAASAGVPCIALAGDPETRELADRLQQPVLPTAVEPGEAAQALRSALHHGVPGAVVRAESATAAEMLRLLRLLVEGGREDLNGISGLRLTPDPSHPSPTPHEAPPAR
jgi:hypothetical protein